MTAPDGSTCAREEALIDCPTCMAAWAEMAEECDYQIKCDAGDEWKRRELVDVDNMRACPECVAEYRRRQERADDDREADRYEARRDRSRGFDTLEEWRGEK